MCGELLRILICRLLWAADQNNQRFFIIFNQFLGGMAVVLQNLAIALAPLASVAIINALAGVQYAFLFILTTVISIYFPNIIKEKLLRG